MANLGDTTVCIKDRFKDVHARRLYGEANPEAIERVASELAQDASLDDDERFKVGLSPVADVGAARLQENRIEWLYDTTLDELARGVTSSGEKAHVRGLGDTKLSKRAQDMVATFTRPQITPEQAAALDHNMKTASGGYRSDKKHEDVDKVLEDANTLLEASGIEAIRGEWHDNYYQDIVALYVNMGDTYSATIYYDAVKGQFHFGSYGDFVEKYGDKYGVR